MTLGSWPIIDLASARELAREALTKVLTGVDPAAVTDRQNGESSQRIENVCEEFIERYLGPNTKSSTMREMTRLLRRNVVPAWKGRLIVDISRRDVIALLDTMIARKAPVSANRLLAVLRRMFNWAIERDLRSDSPCDRVRAPTHEQARDRLLSNSEIGSLWRACNILGWPFGPLFQLLILTGQRREEVAGIRWSELDLERCLWILPHHRAKNNTEHLVPLSEGVMTILRSLPRLGHVNDFVFSTTGRTTVSGFSRAKLRIDVLMQAEQSKPLQVHTSHSGHTSWRNHDLRRTMATRMAGLGADLVVVEKILNHTSGSLGGVVGVYQRHSYLEEKRVELEKWSQFVKEIVKAPFQNSSEMS